MATVHHCFNIVSTISTAVNIFHFYCGSSVSLHLLGAKL